MFPSAVTVLARVEVDEVESGSNRLSNSIIDFITTDTDDEDTVMVKAKTVVEQKADEEHEADEEQKGDEHARDEQVVVHVSTTQKGKPNLLQSTSSHSVSSNFGNQFINSPNASLIAVKELKQADHSIAILASIRSQVPSVVEEYLGLSLPDALKKNFSPKSLPQAIKEALEKTPPSLGQSSSQELYDVLTWSMLLDEATMKEGDKPDKVIKKRDRRDDQDEDPLAGSNKSKKIKKRRCNEFELSKKTSTTKESSKGKSLAKTSKSSKSVTAEELVIDPIFKKALDDVKQTFNNKVGDVVLPPHTDADKTQADVAPKILKKDCLRIHQSLNYLIQTGIQSKTLMMLQNSHGLMR
ncbi:hypothetical protein Tco_0563987 [Tanacetum coccineum]